jgi:hypothetical protein
LADYRAAVGDEREIFARSVSSVSGDQLLFLSFNEKVKELNHYFMAMLSLSQGRLDSTRG